MDPMLKRWLLLATFLVMIPLAMVVIIYWISIWLFRMAAPLTSIVTAVTNNVGIWPLTNADNHHHMTSMTSAPHQPTLNTATTTLHHWSSTECGIGMILLIALLLCVSIIASRSLSIIPIDVTHVYTWKLSQTCNKTDDLEPVSSLPQALPSIDIVKLEATSPPSQPLELSSTGIMSSSHGEQSPTSSSIVEMSTGAACGSPPTTISTMTTLITKMEGSLSDDTQMEMTQPSDTAEVATTTATTTTSSMEKVTSLNAVAIDKRKKKRNKHLKKKDRVKRMSAAEQQSNEQQQSTRTKPGDFTANLSQTQKMSVKTSPQSTILVPPSLPPPPPPCDDQDSSISPLTPTPVTVPLVPDVTQEQFSVKPLNLSISNRSPPSPSVSPNDHHPSTTSTKGESAMTASPPLTPTPQQPMVIKFVSHKKDPSHTSPLVRATSSSSSLSSATKASTSFSSTPSPPSSSTIATAPTTGRQSWYSPFNTGLEFDLLSRSPPSPAHTYVSTSSSSSPSLSASSISFNQADYRLFSDPPLSRPPQSQPSQPPVPPSIGGYNNQLHQQQQGHQLHQLHQYQSHSHSHPPASLSLQQYQHRHPPHAYPIQQHHPFQPPPQLYHTIRGSTYDQLAFGSMPTPTPPSSSKQKDTLIMKPGSPMYTESSSSIADLLPPPTNARLPTPPVSLSPVIAPPALPPPSSSSSPSSGESPSSSKVASSAFPFSLWYPWKPRTAGSDSQPPTLHHHHHHHHQQQQQQQHHHNHNHNHHHYHQELTYQENTTAIDGHQPTSFSLFDRKLSFHTGNASRSHDTSPSQQ